MNALLLCVSLATTPPPVAGSLPAEAVAWVHVPELTDALKRLERSKLAGLGEWLLPAALRKALARGKGHSELVVAWFGEAPDGGPDALLALEAGATARGFSEALRAHLVGLGFTAAAPQAHGALTLQSLQQRAGELVLFHGAGRVGWSTRAARAEGILAPAAAALASTPAFQRLQGDLRAHLAMPRLYGLWARRPSSDRAARIAQRLGLERLDAIDVSAQLVGRDALRMSVLASGVASGRGLADVLGPEVPRLVPAFVPADALDVARASVRPTKLYTLALQLLAAWSPMDAMLAQTQLKGIEAQLGKRLAEDVLGEAARTWTLYRRRGAAGPVLVADLADADGALLFVEAFMQAAVALRRGLRYERGVLGRAPTAQLTGAGLELVAGVVGGQLVIASGRKALEAHAAAKGRERALGPGESAAYGLHEGALALVGESLATLGVAAGEAPRGVGDWQLRARDGALELGIDLRARR